MKDSVTIAVESQLKRLIKELAVAEAKAKAALALSTECRRDLQRLVAELAKEVQH